MASTSIGQRIRSRRIGLHLKQADLARAVRITVSALSQIETGETRSPAALTLLRIADALGTSVRFLLTGAQWRTAPDLSTPAPPDWLSAGQEGE